MVKILFHKFLKFFNFFSNIIRSNNHLPFTAIGGIKEHNLHEIISRGAKNVCLVSDIVGADNITEKVKELQKLIK